MADNKTSILLTADDRTRAAFESAKRGLMGLEAAGGRLNAVLGTLGAGALAGGGLLAFAKAGIDAADNLNDLSQKIGIGVEQLSGYRLAAEQSGTSLEGFGTAARQLAKHIAENDPLLARLGVTSKDMNGALKQLADVFQALPDGADKTALAMKLMGKSGADMIPMLNGGGAALEKMLADGKALYGVTADMAKAADEFNDEMARMKVVTEAASVKVGGVLVKAFNDAVTAYQNFRKEHGALLSTLGAAGAAFVSPFKSSDAEKAIELQEKRNRLLEQAKKIEAGSGSADVKAGGVAVLRGEIAKLEDELGKIWAKGKIDLKTKDQLKAMAAQTRGDFEGVVGEETAEAMQKSLMKAFDLKPMDDYIAKLKTNAGTIKQEYARLAVELESMGEDKEDSASGLGVFQKLGGARSAFASGNSAKAEAMLSRAKASLKSAVSAGTIGVESSYYVRQLEEFEQAMNETKIKTAEATRETMAENFKAAQDAFLQNPMKIKIDFDELGRNIREFVASVSQDLVLQPNVRPVLGNTPGVQALTGTSTAVGAR